MTPMNTTQGITLGPSGEVYSFFSNYITGNDMSGINHKQNRL